MLLGVAVRRCFRFKGCTGASSASCYHYLASSIVTTQFGNMLTFVWWHSSFFVVTGSCVSLQCGERYRYGGWVCRVIVAIRWANVPHCYQLLQLCCDDWNFVFCRGAHLCHSQFLEFLVREASLKPEATYLWTGKGLRGRSETSMTLEKGVPCKNVRSSHSDGSALLVAGVGDSVSWVIGMRYTAEPHCWERRTNGR